MEVLFRVFLIVRLVKNLPAIQETRFNSWVGKILWRRDRLPTPVFLGFPCGSAGKESACNAGDLGSIPGLGRSPREGKGYPLQYSGLENSMDCIVHGVAKSRTWPRDFHFSFQIKITVKCLSHSGHFYFSRFFLMWIIFKVFIEFVTILFLFYVLVFQPQNMWDLSYLIRDRTGTPCIGRQSPILYNYVLLYRIILQIYYYNYMIT